MAFVVANSLILLVTSVVGIAANIFVLLAVYHQKSLQTSNNALVVNLAITDILRCVIDCPVLLTIIMIVYQRGHVNTFICDTQVASFSFSCCLQLLTLACISAERYQAIAKPFKTKQQRKRIMILIPLTWTLAVLVTVFSLIFVKDSPVNVRCQGSQRETLSSYDSFGLYMLLPLWAVCFGVIIGFYARIFTLVRSHNRKIFDKGTSHLPKKDKTRSKQKKEEIPAVECGHGKSEQTQTLSRSVAQVEHHSDEPDLSKIESLTSTNTPQCVSISSEKKEKNVAEITDFEQPCHFAVNTEENTSKTEQSNTCATEVEAKPSNGGDVVSVKSFSTKPQKVSSNLDTENQSKERARIEKAPSEMRETSLHAPAPAQLENPGSAVLLIEPKQDTNSNGGETQTVTAAHQVSSLPPVSVSVPEEKATKQTVILEGAVCMMPSKANRERVNKKKESKMAKRAGYIILTFLLFWLPLITTTLVNFAVYKINNTQVSVDYELLRHFKYEQ